MKKPVLRVKAYPHSPTARYVIEGLRVNGKRRRLFFRSRGEAELELRRLKIKRTREGEESLGIPDTLRLEARDCASALAPFGKTIRQATDFYLEHLEAANRSITVNSLVKEFQASRVRACASSSHLVDLRHRLGQFCASFGEVPVRTLTTRSIEDWLHARPLGPTSKNNYQLRLSTLFNYGIRRNYLSANPVSPIERIKVVDQPPEIFRPEELQALLNTAPADLVPMLVIGAFAGLRTAELLRLDWSDVDLASGFVHVGAAKSKTARRRLVPIAPNLAEWLTPYVKRRGKLYPCSAALYHKQSAKAAKAAGLAHWPSNGLRHSFASYHLAAYQNAPELSLYMGHTAPQMLFAHYREVVRPHEAARYWAIRPLTAPENVVQLQARAR